MWFGSSAIGPPPRAWGIPSVPPAVIHAMRSTPTCVGNTEVEAGEVFDLSGPPPRAWGIRLLALADVGVNRSTPTCVGNTTRPRRLCGGHTVHPHVRGEYLWTTPGGGELYGPPPRAWGIRAGLS